MTMRLSSSGFANYRRLSDHEWQTQYDRLNANNFNTVQPPPALLIEHLRFMEFIPETDPSIKLVPVVGWGMEKSGVFKKPGSQLKGPDACQTLQVELVSVDEAVIEQTRGRQMKRPLTEVDPSDERVDWWGVERQAKKRKEANKLKGSGSSAAWSSQPFNLLDAAKRVGTPTSSSTQPVSSSHRLSHAALADLVKKVDPAPAKTTPAAPAQALQVPTPTPQVPEPVPQVPAPMPGMLPTLGMPMSWPLGLLPNGQPITSLYGNVAPSLHGTPQAAMPTLPGGLNAQNPLSAMMAGLLPGMMPGMMPGMIDAYTADRACPISAI
ncbi:hypothetical protein RI367_002403 [Sorochytrium milnesiophthora]